MKIFISHSSTDKKFVRTLKDDLKENSFNTWVDEDELNFGDSLIDKLEAALEESSHFLIILSPASVNSEWVKFELTKALKKKETQLLQKVIPVKYSQCDVPQELSKLLYADLSNDVRRIHGEKVFFVSDGYDSFLNKLCKTIRNSEQALSNKDKIALKKELEKKDTQDSISPVSSVIKATYNISGYASGATRMRYVELVRKGSTDSSLHNSEKIRPVLLPPLLKNTFPNIKLGDKIFFSKNYLFNEVGHFAGFRKDDLSITVDPRIRKEISIDTGEKYNVEVDNINMRITFLS